MVGGGGGAGGFTESQKISFGQQTIRVVVGQGGPGAVLFGAVNDTYIGTSTDNAGRSFGASRLANNGQASVVGSITVTGGGRGATLEEVNKGITIAQGLAGAGGSGGGGGGMYDGNNAQFGGAGTPGQGNAGGTTVGGDWQASGGGGASAPGNAGAAAQAGNGGAGRISSISGTATFYAGGGGGSRHNTTTAHGVGGVGGGGEGANILAADGALNTGGGGGGAGGNWTNDSYGGNGGSGVVLLSWGSGLEVFQTPIGSRPGGPFTRPIQIQLTDLSGNRILTTGLVSVTASNGVLQFNGTTLTQSLTVNAVDGIATFTGLGFSSSVNSAQTLVFTSDAYRYLDGCVSECLPGKCQHCNRRDDPRNLL
jgi:hypothetical protein